VTAVAGHPDATLPTSRWRDPAVWITAADTLAILVALSLPWSTSLVSIFAVPMLLALVPFFDAPAFLRTLRQPISLAPVALFLLAAIGMLWSDAPWGDKLHAVNPTAKLLVLPFLFYHFERSRRGLWVFVAFLASCTLLMVMSWIVTFEPSFALKPAEEGVTRGIFVKNYIDQGQEFTLCAVALAYPVISLLRAKRMWLAVLLSVIGLSFIINMTFVIVSRTALVTMPIMVAVFGLLHLRLRTNLMILAAAVVVAATAWIASPQLETTVKRFSTEYEQYKDAGRATSIGERLEYWKYALRFFADAPLMGHGTGSTKGLFDKAASRPGWVTGTRVFPNPHNQTLNVAVQWGVIGIAVLYTMWIVHLLLFRGEGLASWVGLLVVVQNIFTSLLNSHIFDFHEGWMYVLGVGVAGGIVLRERLSGSNPEAAGP
jgi:O-antigen ligase